MTFDILNKPSLVVSAVRFITSMYKILLCAVRFIAQKQWFVAGDYEGHIHVYTHATKYKLRKFQAHENMINSLAVHPTDPFVLSSSNDNLIKLWNWENGWECITTFQAHSKWVESVKFNPLATSNTFASASRDGTIKVD
jgi:coatomer subunit beta'